MGDAKALGDLIGGLEPDPPHLASESIRLAAAHLDRVVAVGLVNPHRQRGRHPHALEADHHLLDGPLLLPRRGDHPGALGTKPRHLDQPPWGLLDHLEGGLAEMLDDPLGHLGADPLDQSRAEIAADPLNRRWQHGGVGLDLELAAVLGMAGPAAPQPQALPRLSPKQRPDHGQQITGPVGGHAGHGVARLFVGVGDPLQHRVQGRRRRLRLLHERDCTARTRPCRHPASPTTARVCDQQVLVAGKAMGLPGGRGSPIEGGLLGDRGQAACPSRALRPARRAASTASPPDSARATTSTLSDATSQPDRPLGSAADTGVLVGWRQDSPTWLSVGGRRGSPATVGSSGATCGWRQDSPTWAWVGGCRASWLLVGWSLDWPWATAVRPARFMAARVAANTRVRASLDMVASDLSTDAGWIADGRLGGSTWPTGQLPPATGQPSVAPVARPTSVMRESGMGGLLVPLGDALLGQQLAQPGMLVVHVLFLP